MSVYIHKFAAAFQRSIHNNITKKFKFIGMMIVLHMHEKINRWQKAWACLVNLRYNAKLAIKRREQAPALHNN